MANGEHKKVILTPNDLVIISASPILGNEKIFGKVIDDFMKIGTEVVAGPDVISRGFVYVRESENLMDDVKQMLIELVRECETRELRDWATIKSLIKDNLKTHIYQKTKRNPMILPII